jgi:hypothetical protein
MPTSHPAFQENVFAEFRRIGFDPDRVPILATSGVTPEEFLEMLRAIPTGAGFEAFSAMMNALPHPPPPLWSVYPDAGDLFSYDEYMAAFIVHNASPAHLARYYTRRRRRGTLDVHALAHLSCVSPELDARVTRFRDEVRYQRRADGVDEEILTRADDTFREMRDGAEISFAEYREHQRRDGQYLYFRLHAETTDTVRDAFLKDVHQQISGDSRAWVMNYKNVAHHGGVQFTTDVPDGTVERVLRWLKDRSEVAETFLPPERHGSPPWLRKR